MFRLFRNLSVLFLLVSFHSCVPSHKLYYFHDQKPSTQTIDYTKQNNILKIRKGDRLNIIVTCPDPAQTAFLNPFPTQSAGTQNQQYSGYLVSNTGNIEFPMIGTLSVVGLTPEEATVLIKKKLEFFFKDPYVYVNLSGHIYFMNGRTGTTISLLNERLTIFEAISQSGQQDAYDKKNEVWLIREENGERIFAQLDLNSKEIFNSPYYYLHTNDVVYMQPGKWSSFLGPNSPGRAIITVTGAALSLFLLFKNL